MVDPRVRIEVGALPVLHHEVRAERGQREAAAGAQRSSDGRQDGGVVTIGGHQPERALTQADDCVELAVERHRPRVEPLERGALRRYLAGEVDESLTDVDAVHPDAAPGQCVRVAARSAADIEDAGPRFQCQRLDEEVDLLSRALRERIAQVGPPEMIRHVLEPVRGRRDDRTVISGGRT